MRWATFRYASTLTGEESGQPFWGKLDDLSPLYLHLHRSINSAFPWKLLSSTADCRDQIPDLRRRCHNHKFLLKRDWEQLGTDADALSKSPYRGAGFWSIETGLCLFRDLAERKARIG
jgi:hypothetical protein